MSIVPLSKVTLLGHMEDKDQVLTDLQGLGCLHLIPLTTEGVSAHAEGPSKQSTDALRFLLACPMKRRQVRDARRFDPVEVEARCLDLEKQLTDLTDEQDFLLTRIDALSPWGGFDLPPRADLAQYRLWFYIVPRNRMREVEATDLIWEVVNQDNRNCYVVVLSEMEPHGMPVSRTRAGRVPLQVLRDRLEEVELALQDIEAERMSLTRWCTLFAQSLNLLDDRAEREQASVGALEEGPLFALQAWAPQPRMGELESYAKEHGLVLESEVAAAEEEPPTLFKNPPALEGGQDLVTFYMTPAYSAWDPSIILFISFSIFFGMILADAGYAAVLFAIALVNWKKLGASATGKRWRILLSSLSACTFIYGVLVGSYFGVLPNPDSFLGKLQLLDMNDSSALMALSILVGCIHLALANFLDFRRYGRVKAAALAPLGWTLVVLGGLSYWGAPQVSMEILKPVGMGAVGLGVLLVAVFTGAGAKPVSRAMQGLLGLTKLTTLFGDVLSYLRLFALGLATASLAAAFNGMAGQVRDAVPGLGLLLAALVLLVGHVMNFVLGMASGFIHGLRLNVIEFFNWALHEEGRLFRPFKRKETVSWNQ